VSSSEIQYLSKAQWSDKLPRMVQAKLVEAYENSGKLGGVGIPGQGLAIDYQVVTDIRAFEIDTGNGSQAVVEISAKILNDRNGSVRAQKVFTQAVPAGGGSNEGLRQGARPRLCRRHQRDCRLDAEVDLIGHRYGQGHRQR
jgi:cholesterol transport system auxiliary component